ncbi:MAG: tetratricopeptide repeat protein [Magnetococcales bacterium]|nr:tetratricopeptide repeat protein [Magnetococcales bacterium]
MLQKSWWKDPKWLIGTILSILGLLVTVLSGTSSNAKEDQRVIEVLDATAINGATIQFEHRYKASGTDENITLDGIKASGKGSKIVVSIVEDLGNIHGLSDDAKKQVIKMLQKHEDANKAMIDKLVSQFISKLEKIRTELAKNQPLPEQEELNLLHKQAQTALGELDVTLAVTHLLKATSIEIRQGKHVGASHTLESIAKAEQARGHNQAAVKHYRRAIDQIAKNTLDSHRERFGFLNDALGRLFLEMGKFEAAEEYFRISLRTVRQLYGRFHNLTAEIYDRLATSQEGQDNFAQAEKSFLESLSIRKKIYPKDHRILGISHNNIGKLYIAWGKRDEADQYLKKAFQIRKNNRKKITLHHPASGLRETIEVNDGDDMASTLNNQGLLLNEVGMYAEAIPILKDASTLLIDNGLAKSDGMARVYNNLAISYGGIGEVDEAVINFKKSLDISKKLHGPVHPDIAKSLNNIGGLLMNNGQYFEAENYLTRAYEIKKEQVGENSVTMGATHSRLGRLHFLFGRYKKAAWHFERGQHIAEKQFPPNHPNLGIIRIRLAQANFCLGNTEKATEILSNGRDILQTSQPNHFLLEQQLECHHVYPKNS